VSALEEAAGRIVRKLRDAGFTAYFAGGCVRDRLRGVQANDIDIATSARPEQVAEVFPRTIPVGVQFGVMIVPEGGQAFEVATFRSDGAYVDGRRPVGVVYSSPEEDALRRDFTVNGLFFDPLDEQVIDYVGGRQDLEQCQLRAIGDPAERFREDKLRVLRGVRFAANLDFSIDPATWVALCGMAPQVREVSIERLRDELVKIFTRPGRVRGLDLLDSSGLLEILLPEVLKMKGCDQPPQFHPEGDVYIHTRLMLSLLGEEEVSPALAFAVLLHDIAKPLCHSIDETGRIRFNGHEHAGATVTKKILQRLKFPNQQVDAAVEMVRNHMAFKDTPNMRPAKLRRFLDRDTFDEELELHRVDCLGSHGLLDIFNFLTDKQKEFADAPLVPARYVTGDDLIALGLQPGPHFKGILEEAHNRQMEGEFADRECALAWLRERVSRN